MCILRTASIPGLGKGFVLLWKPVVRWVACGDILIIVFNWGVNFIWYIVHKKRHHLYLFWLYPDFDVWSHLRSYPEVYTVQRIITNNSAINTSLRVFLLHMNRDNYSSHNKAVAVNKDLRLHLDFLYSYKFSEVLNYASSDRNNS